MRKDREILVWRSRSEILGGKPAGLSKVQRGTSVTIHGSIGDAVGGTFPITVEVPLRGHKATVTSPDKTFRTDLRNGIGADYGLVYEEGSLIGGLRRRFKMFED